MSDVSFLITGAIFGLSGGFMPGPLLTLVISETLRHGIKSGVKVAVAPLLTDAPIILLTIYMLSLLNDIMFIMGIIAICGALFISWLGFESVKFKGVEINADNAEPQSIKKGIIANLLNPSPYMFWFTIGAPVILKALNIGTLPVLYFIIGLYVPLVGAKILIAITVGKSAFFLKSRNYIYTIRFLGIVLFFFAFLFFKDGLKFLGLFG